MQDMVGLWFVLAGVTCVLLGFSVLLLVIGLTFGLCLIDCGLLNCLLGCCGVTWCLLGCLPWWWAVLIAYCFSGLIVLFYLQHFYFKLLVLFDYGVCGCMMMVG